MKSNGMRNTLVRIEHGVAWVIVVDLMVQVFLAGVGIFGAGSLDFHRYNAVVLGVAMLANLLLSFAYRPLVKWSALLLGLVVVQGALISLGAVSPFIAALHPVNALLLIYVAQRLARLPRPASAPAPQPAAAAQVPAHGQA
jgi:hypothetical protein